MSEETLEDYKRRIRKEFNKELEPFYTQLNEVDILTQAEKESRGALLTQFDQIFKKIIR